ncbi:unnamed protein product [Rotaria sp. Silwood2]|nr:unnamed protein product [Rotaria sp. Silwood2]
MGCHQQTVRDFYSSSKTTPIPSKLKLRVTQACTEFCAVDGRAFDVITDDGFQNLAKVLFDAGRSLYKSSIEIKELLPHSTTVSRNVTRLYEEYKLHLVNICEQLNSFCLVVDQWKESYTGISYCGIALRYVDDNYKLFTFILGCFPYDADNHSAPHLREFIIKKLEEFKLKLDLSKYVVSDNEPKMLATFRGYCIRVGCADHYLNKQLQHAFESEQLHVNKNVVEKVDCDIVQNMFNQIKKVVCHIRRSHQQQTLSKKVVSYSDTRFNGALMMMDNFAGLFFELPSALVNSNFMMNYNLIEKDLLDCVSRRLNNAWPITDEHRLATILHPKFKKFECSPNEKEKSINVLKSQFQKHQTIISPSCTNSLVSKHFVVQSSSSNTTPKPNNLLSQCFDAKVKVVDERLNPLQEIDDYLNFEFDESYYISDNSGDIDILLFWKKQQHLFPILSSLAKVIFAIPASNTIIERLFSSSKNVVTEKRTRLSASKINELLFLQKNLNTLKELINNNNRKRTLSMSSTTTASSDESSYTTAKQQRLDTDESLNDFDNMEVFLD